MNVCPCNHGSTPHVIFCRATISYICILILAGPPYKQDHQEKGNAPKARATELPEEQPAANVVVFNGPSSSASRTPQHRTSTVTYSVLYLGIVLIARGLVT